MDDLYEIDLKPFDFEPFYDKVVEIVSRNNGWVNFQKGVFDTVEERDYALFEFEQEFGVRCIETLDFEGEAKELYEALKKAFPNVNLSEKEQQEFKIIFLEILTLNPGEIYQLLFGISNQKLNQVKALKKYEMIKCSTETKSIRFEKLKKIDNRLNNLFFNEYFGKKKEF